MFQWLEEMMSEGHCLSGFMIEMVLIITLIFICLGCVALPGLLQTYFLHWYDRYKMKKEKKKDG